MLGTTVPLGEHVTLTTVLVYLDQDDILYNIKEPLPYRRKLLGV